MYIKTKLGFRRLYELSNKDALEELKHILNKVNERDKRYIIKGHIRDYIESVIYNYDNYEEIRLLVNEDDDISIAFCAWLYSPDAIIFETDVNSSNLFTSGGLKIFHEFNKSIRISYLGSFQSGGGSELLKDILQLGEIENIPVELTSSESAFEFYRKMGMTELKNGDFVWFPKEIQKKISSINWYYQVRSGRPV